MAWQLWFRWKVSPFMYVCTYLGTAFSKASSEFPSPLTALLLTVHSGSAPSFSCSEPETRLGASLARASVKLGWVWSMRRGGREAVLCLPSFVPTGLLFWQWLHPSMTTTPIASSLSRATVLPGLG